MAKKTIFAGLQVLAADESIFTDNAAFTSRDREAIDRGLKIGIKTHRHDASAGLLDPVATPSGAVIGSGGTIAGGLGISLAYTLEDLNGGETLLSPVELVTTPGPLEIPVVAPTGEFSSAAGTLTIDTYTYALTYTDGEGGETPVGPSFTIDRPPGYANGQIKLAGLDAGLEEAGAAGWRLYRARGGRPYVLLATGGLGESEFTDDGSIEPDCDTHPPTDNINTTNQINQLKITIPTDGIITDATFINFYASLTGEFGESSLLEQYPVSSAGDSDFFTSLEFAEQQPPDVNRSYGGASQIDPDTEILDWHWRRPVAEPNALPSGVEGDVRLSLSNRKLYGIFGAKAEGPKDWDAISGASGGVGSGVVVQDGIIVDPAEIIEFIGSGIVGITVDEPLGGKARVTITGSGGAGIDHNRVWGSASIELASGADGDVDFNLPNTQSARLLRISTNKRARVRVYGDEGAREADVEREIGEDPTGDHGVQLDYANTITGSGGIRRLTPLVDIANLIEPPENHVFLKIDNYDAAGEVIIAFQYLPEEGS